MKALQSFPPSVEPPSTPTASSSYRGCLSQHGGGHPTANMECRAGCERISHGYSCDFVIDRSMSSPPRPSIDTVQRQLDLPHSRGEDLMHTAMLPYSLPSHLTHRETLSTILLEIRAPAFPLPVPIPRRLLVPAPPCRPSPFNPFRPHNKHLLHVFLLVFLPPEHNRRSGNEGVVRSGQ